MGAAWESAIYQLPRQFLLSLKLQDHRPNRAIPGCRWVDQMPRIWPPLYVAAPLEMRARKVAKVILFFVCGPTVHI